MKNIFDKNNINHLKCVRDVEMEIRFGDRWSTPVDEFDNVRQYIRDVLITNIKTNDDVVWEYEILKRLLRECESL